MKWTLGCKVKTVVATCLVLYLGLNHLQMENSYQQSVQILMWTKTVGKEIIDTLPDDWVLETSGDSKSVLCPQSKVICKFTVDQTQVLQSDAIWFDAVSILGDHSDGAFPAQRKETQVWIFYNLESPAYLYKTFRPFENIFNWTMTYRSDSDVHLPYGRIIKIASKEKIIHKVFEGQHSNRSKLVAWTVSNCNPSSNRTKIVQELQKYLPVDIYGRCGNLTCPTKRTEILGCLDFQQKIYKFYLAFENSLCEEYVTEKFFHALNSDMIPIVYGLGNYAHIGPSKSFINIKEFPTIKDLATYLKWLDGNPEEYAKYFEWKKDYEVIGFHWSIRNSFCNLCERLFIERTSGWSNKKVYRDLKSWFFQKKHVSRDISEGNIRSVEEVINTTQNDSACVFSK